MSDRKLRPSALATWFAAYATLLLVLWWSRDVQPGVLLVAAALWVVGALLLWRARGSRLLGSQLYFAFGLLALMLLAGALTSWRLSQISDYWPQLVERRETRIRQDLDRRIAGVIERGLRTVAYAAESAPYLTRDELFLELGALRQRSRVDAVAVFGEVGELVAWSGEHRGPLADSVRLGRTGITFIEQPLYSYVYFPMRVPQTRRHAVAAILLGTALHEHAHDPGAGEMAHIVEAMGAAFLSGPGGADAWQMVVQGDTIAHVRIEPISQAQWRAEAITLSQRIILAFAAIVLILLGATWLRRPNRRLATAVPLFALACALAVAPLSALGLEQLFSPALFLLPLPGEASLGTLLAVLVVAGALTASLPEKRTTPRSTTLLLLIGAFAVALFYPAAIRVLLAPGADDSADQVRAAGSMLLLAGPALWFGLQLTAVLLLGIVTELALPRWHWSSPRQATTRVRSPWFFMLLGALATSAALSVTILLLAQTEPRVSPWVAVAWVLPFMLSALALAAYHGSGVRLIRWLTAGWLASTAVLPFLWVAHVDARLQEAERELATLGTNPDPFLDYLLEQFAFEAAARSARGETGVQLLYRSWVGSGLARESYPARIALWSASGQAEVQLSLGEMQEAGAAPLGAVPPYLSTAYARSRSTGDSLIVPVRDVPNVNRALVAPVDTARVVTVEVPPRRTLERQALPFLGGLGTRNATLEMVPAQPGVPVTRRWFPVENGWRSEALVHYPDGDYHVHMDVRMPSFGVRVARGVLLVAFNLVVFSLLWLTGRAARGDQLAVLTRWREWRRSFRARVTAALFFFFLVPTAVFGWVAYGALAREVARATQIVAERAVRQAVVEFSDAAGDLRELAAHAGAEVLYYFNGELAQSSSPEAVELGVYGAWMPAPVFLDLASGEEDADVASRRIGGQQVLTAYRRLPPAGSAASGRLPGALGVPMPLEAGETAVRQRELAHLILFAALMGGLLSLMLSVVVGRTLTGPIGRLQRAAAAVGAGNLRMRLPERTADEFGQLFASFNRMTRRLRRARARELRTARVLAWGEMARQVAHEIKNPLTPIKLAVQHLKRAFADRNQNFGEILDTNVDQIELEIDRLSEIARAFSRYGAPAAATGPLEPVRVNEVVHEALTLYRAGDPDVEYREQLEPDVPRALGRTGELKEVLLNLLENARTALDGTGVITVSARRADGGIELTVTDNGPGIPAEMLPRVFEPHFSTRSAGTGLGLAIVRRLVESWGGQVVAESEVGVGTTVRVNLLEA